MVMVSVHHRSVWEDLLSATPILGNAASMFISKYIVVLISKQKTVFNYLTQSKHFDVIIVFSCSSVSFFVTSRLNLFDHCMSSFPTLNREK